MNFAKVLLSDGTAMLMSMHDYYYYDDDDDDDDDDDVNVSHPFSHYVPWSWVRTFPLLNISVTYPMSHTLLKILAVPKRHTFYSSSSSLATSSTLVTAPSAPITIGTPDTFFQFHIFCITLLSPGSSRPFLVLFLQFGYQKDMPHR